MMRFRRAILSLAFCSLLLYQGRQGLSATTPATGLETADRFTVSFAAAPTQIYGGGDLLPHHFFDEFLPALFKRTLSLTAPIPDGVNFRWIFTGPNGGLTIRFSNNKVTLEQRYYNSYVLSADDPPTQRYPNKIWKQTSASLTSSPRSVTVTLNRLAVTIEVDGKPLLSQQCLLDLMHHQLAVDAPATLREAMTLTLARPAAARVHISVDPTRVHQTILGFGGIMSFPAFHIMPIESQKQWFGIIAENNLLIQREYPIGVRLKKDLSNFSTLADASPHYYGDNFPDGEMSDFDYTRKLRAIGGHVLYEFWGLPGWMLGPAKGSVNAQEYARAIVGYCRQSLIHTGEPPEIVGVQNEVIQGGETWKAMVLQLRKSLNEAGFRTVKLQMPDAPRLATGVRSAETLREDPQVWKDLDFSATHVYDYQDNFGNPDALDPLIQQWRQMTADKPFLLTELAINSPKYQTMDSYQTAFAMAQMYQKSLTALDAKLLAYCWLLLDPEQPTFKQTRSLFVLDRSDSFRPKAAGYTLRTFAAFSRRLPEGMRRVEATSDDPDIRVSAFAAPGIGQTMILLNQSTAPKQVVWAGFGAAFSTLEVVDPYHSNAVAPGSKFDQVTIPPGAIFTLTTVKLRRSGN